MTTTKIKKGKDTQYIYEFGCNMKIGDTLYYKKKLHEVVAITFKLVTEKEEVKPLYLIIDNSNHLSTVYENDPEIEPAK